MESKALVKRKVGAEKYLDLNTNILLPDETRFNQLFSKHGVILKGRRLTIPKHWIMKGFIPVTYGQHHLVLRDEKKRDRIIIWWNHLEVEPRYSFVDRRVMKSKYGDEVSATVYDNQTVTAINVHSDSAISKEIYSVEIPLPANTLDDVIKKIARRESRRVLGYLKTYFPNYEDPFAYWTE